MVAQNVNQLAVVQDGRLVGVLSREDVMHYSLAVGESFWLTSDRDLQAFGLVRGRWIYG